MCVCLPERTGQPDHVVKYVGIVGWRVQLPVSGADSGTELVVARGMLLVIDFQRK